MNPKPIAFVTMISHGLTDYSRSLRSELPNVAFLQEIDKSLAAMGSVIAHAGTTSGFYQAFARDNSKRQWL